jgi:sugar phosphate isomerase/epimerase
MISRRKFISTTAVAGAVLPLAGFQNLSVGDLQKPAGSKIHVFTKPFQWMTYKDMSELVAKAGAGGIDLPVRPGGHVLPENVERDLPLAAMAAKEAGLSMEMIVTGIVSATEKYTEQILKTAASAGVKYYRLGWIPYDEAAGITGTLKNLKDELKKLQDLNAKYGLHGAYQNHSGNRVGGAVWDLYELFRDADPRYLGVQYDVRHAVVEGANSWVNGLNLVAPWVKCTDIKDFTWSQSGKKWAPETVALGEGAVNFDEYFKTVKKRGITGPVSLHLEYPPFEKYTGDANPEVRKKLCLDALKKDVATLKGWIEKYQV